MFGAIRLVSVLAMSLLPVAARALPTAAGAEEAIERQRSDVRDVVTRRCADEADEETIVVCGQLLESGGGGADGSAGYVPPARFSAPGHGPWFEIRRGPLSITCCSVDGMRGTGAGLSLRIRF